MWNREVYIERDFVTRGYNFYFREKIPGSDYVSYVTDIELTEYDLRDLSDSGYKPFPLTLLEGATQDLFDQLYHAGFRPSRSSGDDKAVQEAQEAHIESLSEELGLLHKIVHKVLDK